MINIEDFIRIRKLEDKLNEKNMNIKTYNIEHLISYIFEYYNRYSDALKIDQKKESQTVKLIRYQKTISMYSNKIQEWLLKLYSETGIKYNLKFDKLLCDDDFIVLLLSIEADYTDFSYHYYAKVIKHNPILEYDAELITKYIIESCHYRASTLLISDELKNIPIKASHKKIIREVYKVHKVNLLLWAKSYIHLFNKYPGQWPAKLKVMIDDKITHNYKDNLANFNAGPILTKANRIPYLRRRKELLKVLLMYYWLKDVENNMSHFDKYYNLIISDSKKTPQ